MMESLIYQYGPTVIISILSIQVVALGFVAVLTFIANRKSRSNHLLVCLCLKEILGVVKRSNENLATPTAPEGTPECDAESPSGEDFLIRRYLQTQATEMGTLARIRSCRDSEDKMDELEAAREFKALSEEFSNNA